MKYTELRIPRYSRTLHPPLPEKFSLDSARVEVSTSALNIKSWLVYPQVPSGSWSNSAKKLLIHFISTRVAFDLLFNKGRKLLSTTSSYKIFSMKIHLVQWPQAS